MFYETKYGLATILVSLRLAPLFLFNAIPIFSYLPTRFKVGFIFIFALMIVSILEQTEGLDYVSGNSHSFSLIRLAMSELITGFTVAVPLFLIAFVLSLSGKFWDYAHGFATLNAINPGHDNLVSIYGKVFLVVFTFLFFELNLHHDLILMLIFSFHEIPMGSGFFNLGIGDYLSKVGFASGVIVGLSFPVVFALLLFDFVSSYLVRSNPGFNVYFIGLPAKVLIGMAVFHLSIGSLMGHISSFLRSALGVDL